MTMLRFSRDQKRNQKLICRTSSVECQEQMWVILSDYPRYMNQIWYAAQETVNRDDIGIQQGILMAATARCLFSLHVIESISDDYNLLLTSTDLKIISLWYYCKQMYYTYRMHIPHCVHIKKVPLISSS